MIKKIETACSRKGKQILEHEVVIMEGLMV